MEPSSNQPLQHYARKVWIAVGIVGSTILAMWLVWMGLEIILMVMAGPLLLNQMENGQSVRDAFGNFVFRITSVFSTTFGALTVLLLVIVNRVYINVWLQKES